MADPSTIESPLCAFTIVSKTGEEFIGRATRKALFYFKDQLTFSTPDNFAILMCYDEDVQQSRTLYVKASEILAIDFQQEPKDAAY